MFSLTAVAHADEYETHKFMRACRTIESTYQNDRDIQKLKASFIRMTMVGGITDPRISDAPDISQEIKRRAADLRASFGTPEYAEALKTVVESASREYVGAYKSAHEWTTFNVSDEKLKTIYQCYALNLADTNSLAHQQAMKAFSDAEDRIHRIHDEEVRVEQYQARAEAKEREYLDQQRKLNERRNNPVSNVIDIGPFTNQTDSCTTSKSVNFGFTTINAQPGSKFLILQASVKNNSNTGKYITPGSVIIDYKGNPYRFNVVEEIVGDPLQIPETPINPLITQKIRVIYRIADEVTGKVRWQPGMNPQDLTVRCGTI